MFETPQEILQDYESRPRALTKEFLADLRRDEVKNHPLDPKFFPVLLYMRDIERYTEVYFEELRHTPTCKEPAIKKFMERWNDEEAQHGDLLNRFLQEAGYPTPTDWYPSVKARISHRYRIEARVGTAVMNLFGKYFVPTHMVWGAINELTALQAYRRLSELADHPVLTQLLRAIMQEESVHVFFYYNLAELGLSRSRFSQGLARTMIRYFWTPVGAGIKPRDEAGEVLYHLFGNAEGQKTLKNHIEGRFHLLPGCSEVKILTQKINELIQLFKNKNSTTLG